jgi:alanyl-tRNA synthetase
VAHYKFDFDTSPPPERWLSLDEDARIAAVRDAHTRTRSAVGQSPEAHAALHVVVETRLAEGDRVVLDTYERFRAAGIRRHTTIHALASVVARQMSAILEHGSSVDQATSDGDFAALSPTDWQPKNTP